jgi:uncharacterized membrane protein YdjX (TVP38/TMEM64 family)
MKRHWLKILFLLLIVGAVVGAKLLVPDHYLTIAKIEEEKERLLLLIESHYVMAVLTFLLLYLSTAFFLPGALVLTVAGGMMFGTLYTAIYANIAATIGAILAFLLARFVFGHWVQEKFHEPLTRFNDELSRHGHNYLLVLRILPLAPFFVVNYCAGITKIPLRTYIWTTSVGMFPGALLYAFIGEQLREMRSPADILTWKVVVAFVLLALFALLPVALHHFQSRK